MPTEILNCDGKELQWFSNVTNYTWTESNHYAWQITYESKDQQPQIDRPFYFILDSANHEAFSHWVFENSTWIPSYLELKQRYPTCKLVLEKHKDFKNLFLSFYGIEISDVCLHSEIDSTNYCFFHRYVSLNDPHVSDSYKKIFSSFKEKLDEITCEKKDISILYLPRGTKENLQTNDRIYNIQDDLRNYILNVGGTVYETDSTTSLETQIQIVKRAHMIILDYGSNLWVNGLFSKDSYILCLNLGWTHDLQFPSMGLIWEEIAKQNIIYEIFAHHVIKDDKNNLSTVFFFIGEIIHKIESVLEGR